MKNLLFITFLIYSILGYCNSNFYIKLGNKNVVIGKYVSNGNKIKKVVLEKSNPESVDVINLLSLEDKNILFYFHGIQSNDLYNQKYALKRLKKISNVDATVSIIWKSKSWIYTKAWKKAFHQTIPFEKLIVDLLSKNKSSILCHSMGNRIFEGLYFRNPIKLNNIIFAAPDLNLDVFNSSLKSLDVNANQIYIYSNKKDRMLKLSKFAHRKDRLGLNILDYPEFFSNKNNIKVIDVTHYTNSKKDKLTKHSYWMKNPLILSEINENISKL